jgi:hypothetical protein
VTQAGDGDFVLPGIRFTMPAAMAYPEAKRFSVDG